MDTHIKVGGAEFVNFYIKDTSYLQINSNNHKSLRQKFAMSCDNEKPPKASPDGHP